jgi:dihydroorotate dehydrogenase (fumarate)
MQTVSAWPTLKEVKMVNQETTYMGIPLKNPIIAGASRLTGHLDSLKKIEAAGAGAIVIKSLFEEQIEMERSELDEGLTRYDDQYAEMITTHPHIEHAGPEGHLMLLQKARDEISIPVIASLNAVHRTTWLEYAKLMEKTGIDGLELNFYSMPADIDKDAQNLENEMLTIVEEIIANVSVPVSIRLSPFYTNPGNFISRLDRAGVKACVLFNRLYQPDIEITTEQHIFPFSLSSKKDNRLALQYAGLLYGQVQTDLCCSTGIYQGSDVVKMILAGATCIQAISALFASSISHISTMLQDIEQWMDNRSYTALDDFRGKLSKKCCPQKWVYEREQYVKMLFHSDEHLGKLQTENTTQAPLHEKVGALNDPAHSADPSL